MASFEGRVKARLSKEQTQKIYQAIEANNSTYLTKEAEADLEESLGSTTAQQSARTAKDRLSGKLAARKAAPKAGNQGMGGEEKKKDAEASKGREEKVDQHLAATEVVKEKEKEHGGAQTQKEKEVDQADKGAELAKGKEEKKWGAMTLKEKVEHRLMKAENPDSLYDHLGEHAKSRLIDPNLDDEMKMAIARHEYNVRVRMFGPPPKGQGS